jgi:hypothetical protein
VLDEADELPEKSGQDKKKTYYYNLDCVKDDQDEYQQAFFYFEKVVDICQKTHPPNHSHFAMFSISYSPSSSKYVT